MDKKAITVVMIAYIRPEIERASEGSLISDASYNQRPSGYLSRRVVNLHRPQRRLLSRYFPFHPEHRKFLRFAFQGQAYKFAVLPFGPALAPCIFTRCMRAALTSLCLTGLTILPYLDDWLICALSLREANDIRVPRSCRGAGHVCKLGEELVAPETESSVSGLSVDAGLPDQLCA